MRKSVFSAILFSLLAAGSITGQAVRTLDELFTETVAREFPGSKAASERGIYRIDPPVSLHRYFSGSWKKGGNKLEIHVSLFSSAEEMEERYRMFFFRPIMPPSFALEGIGAKAVLVDPGTRVEIQFTKENLLVTLNWNFPSPELRRPQYHQRAPKAEIDRLTKIATALASEIEGPRTLSPCKNDFYNTAPAKPKTDTERLLDAASKGDTALVSDLIAHDVPANAADGDGYSSLHLAVRVGCMTTVRTLVTGGANVNAASAKGETPLMTAAMLGEMKILEFLLASGADIKARDTHGRNAAFFAISNPAMTYPVMNTPTYDDQITMLKMLKKAGVDINERMTLNGDTLLTYQMYSYGIRLNLIKDLIDLGVDVNGRIAQGQTILIRAVSGGVPSGRNKLVSMLLEKGADVNIKDDRGYTAMDYLLEDQKQRARFPEWQKDIAETIRLLEEPRVKR